jgi:hypothetical protein
LSSQTSILLCFCFASCDLKWSNNLPLLSNPLSPTRSHPGSGQGYRDRSRLCKPRCRFRSALWVNEVGCQSSSRQSGNRQTQGFLPKMPISNVRERSIRISAAHSLGPSARVGLVKAGSLDMVMRLKDDGASRPDFRPVVGGHSELPVSSGIVVPSTPNSSPLALSTCPR